MGRDHSKSLDWADDLADCAAGLRAGSSVVERAVFDFSAVVLPRPPPPCAMWARRSDVRKLQLLFQLSVLGP